MPLAEVNPLILVPDDGLVTWRYTKNTPTQDDFAVVDNIRVETNSLPDLVLTGLNYTPGEYILDVAGYVDAPNQLLGTEYLDISVEASNVGETIPATNFSSGDIEVRLSSTKPTETMTTSFWAPSAKSREISRRGA